MRHAHASGRPSDPTPTVLDAAWNPLPVDDRPWSATTGHDPDADRGRSWAVDYEEAE